MNEILIYQSTDKAIELQVAFDRETVWLTQSQITELFGRDRTVITKHINNVFKEGELEEKSNVQKMHITNVDKPTTLYSLDVIISVGYRVKSLRGTQFRQWATQRLKDHLVQGYSINQKRLDELGKMVQLIAKSGASHEVQLSEAKGLLEILGNYTKSFSLLNQYDTQQLRPGTLSKHITYEIEYSEAVGAVTELRKQLVAKIRRAICSEMKKMKASGAP